MAPPEPRQPEVTERLKVSALSKGKLGKGTFNSGASKSSSSWRHPFLEMPWRLRFFGVGKHDFQIFPTWLKKSIQPEVQIEIWYDHWSSAPLPKNSSPVPCRELAVWAEKLKYVWPLLAWRETARAHVGMWLFLALFTGVGATATILLGETLRCHNWGPPKYWKWTTSRFNMAFKRGCMCGYAWYAWYLLRLRLMVPIAGPFWWWIFLLRLPLTLLDPALWVLSPGI